MRFLSVVPKMMVLLALSVPIKAADPEKDLGSMSLADLLQIEVTSASKFSQKTNEAPSVITVKTADQIRTYGWQTLNDVLHKMPGFGPGQDFERSTTPTRGLFDSWSNNHILHLVDGIPMNDNLYGSAFTWELSPIFMTRSLEIIRGPGSALYGSNATNGVIQVNTLSPGDLKDRFHVNFRGGSQESQALEAMTGHQSEYFDVIVALYAGKTDGNGYLSHDGSGRFDNSGELARFPTRDKRENSYLWAKIEGKGLVEGLSLQFHQQDWDFQTGHGWLWWIPDFKETMKEQRRILAIKYSPPTTGLLQPELVLRYQRHDITWNQRFYPNNAFDGYYPSGMWEFLDTDAEDLFARAQLAFQLPKGANLLVGFEGDRFIYRGDREHYSNVNVDSPFFEPFPEDRNNPLGPWLDFILDEPLLNTGFYGQFSSGDLLGSQWNLTLGVRYDRLSFDFNRIYDEGRPKDSKSFSRTSPRLALVYQPNQTSTYKMMAGKAFRAPTPTELAGAHTFSLASNIDQLQPELITTFELAGDWMLDPSLNLQVNLFRTEFQNQIAYSTANNNLSTNVFSQTNQGAEAELLFHWGRWTSFLNLSYAQLVDEEIQDETIALHDSELTWEPSEKVNLGVAWNAEQWEMGAGLHYQGSISRRNSDVGQQELPLGVGVTLDLDGYRPQELGSWFSLDTRLSWMPHPILALSLDARNLLDDQHHLVKTGPFPFDYQDHPRRIYLNLRLSF